MILYDILLWICCIVIILSLTPILALAVQDNLKRNRIICILTSIECILFIILLFGVITTIIICNHISIPEKALGIILSTVLGGAMIIYYFANANACYSNVKTLQKNNIIQFTSFD